MREAECGSIGCSCCRGSARSAFWADLCRRVQRRHVANRREPVLQSLRVRRRAEHDGQPGRQAGEGSDDGRQAQPLPAAADDPAPGRRDGSTVNRARLRRRQPRLRARPVQPRSRRPDRRMDRRRRHPDHGRSRATARRDLAALRRPGSAPSCRRTGSRTPARSTPGRQIVIPVYDAGAQAQAAAPAKSQAAPAAQTLKAAGQPARLVEGRSPPSRRKRSPSNPSRRCRPRRSQEAPAPRP